MNESTITLKPIAEPVALAAISRHTCASTSISANGEVITLWVPETARDEIFGYIKAESGATFPVTRVDLAYTGRVVIASANETRYCNLPDLNFAFPRVQVLPDGEILAASTRCRRWKDGSYDLNARVYRPDGALKSEFCLGDGIEHMQTDTSGRIWVGYFDEGVFGNFGWGTSSENPPIGASGLVCFNVGGQKIWEYKPPEGFGYIVDCYVLNCADDAVWACAYTHFPFIRVDQDFEVKAWSAEIRGPRQIAVDGDTVLAYGGYQEKAHDCWLLRLSDSLAHRVSQVRLELPDPVNLSEATVIGRGKFLNVVVNGFWYRFEVPR